MRVALIPAGTAFASARIRVYNLQRALGEFGVTTTRGYFPSANPWWFRRG